MNRFYRFALSLSAIVALVAFAAPAFAETLGQAEPWQLGFQTAASPVKERMEVFHNGILLPMAIGISVFVMGLLLFVMVRFNAKSNPVPSKTTHNVMLEIIWTLVPVLILVIIVIPSMKLLYFADKTVDAEMTVKVTGYQWYWGYEYPDHGGINFMSNMVKDEELKDGQPRLLATDNAVVVPVDTNIRIVTTASDVLHSWAMPALGVKMDAVPGRLNETWMRVEKEGTFYGQCSELCGVNHGFMPIEVKAVSKDEFAKWVAAHGGDKKAQAEQPAAAMTAAAATNVEKK
jgi:cytochrome c oxidase subunit 2